MTTKRQLLTKLQKSGVVIIAEGPGGALWWTDTYAAAVMPPIVAELLDDFNLPAEPMCCDIDAVSIRRNDREPPDLSRLVARAVDSADLELTQARIGGDVVYTTGRWGHIEHWTPVSSPGAPTHALPAALLDLTDDLIGSTHRRLFGTDGRLAPVIRYTPEADENGDEPAAMVMPVARLDVHPSEVDR